MSQNYNQFLVFKIQNFITRRNVQRKTLKWKLDNFWGFWFYIENLILKYVLWALIRIYHWRKIYMHVHVFLEREFGTIFQPKHCWFRRNHLNKQKDFIYIFRFSTNYMTGLYHKMARRPSDQRGLSILHNTGK